jgi:hypothetical protein
MMKNTNDEVEVADHLVVGRRHPPDQAAARDDGDPTWPDASCGRLDERHG